MALRPVTDAPGVLTMGTNEWKHPDDRRVPYERYQELNPAHRNNVATVMQTLIDRGDTCMSFKAFRNEMRALGGQPAVSSRLRQRHIRMLLQDNGASVDGDIVELLGLSGSTKNVYPNPLDCVATLIERVHESGESGVYPIRDVYGLVRSHMGSNCPAAHVDKDSLGFFLKQAGASVSGSSVRI